MSASPDAPLAMKSTVTEATPQAVNNPPSDPIVDVDTADANEWLSGFRLHAVAASFLIANIMAALDGSILGKKSCDQTSNRKTD